MLYLKGFLECFVINQTSWERSKSRRLWLKCDVEELSVSWLNWLKELSHTFCTSASRTFCTWTWNTEQNISLNNNKQHPPIPWNIFKKFKLFWNEIISYNKEVKLACFFFTLNIQVLEEIQNKRIIYFIHNWSLLQHMKEWILTKLFILCWETIALQMFRSNLENNIMCDVTQYYEMKHSE